MKHYCLQCGREFKLNRGKQVYCSRACLGVARTGPGNPNYKGGFTRPDGYRIVMVAGKRVLEHRLIMEQHVGRSLLPTEVVHHKDRNPSNNCIDNLVLMTNSVEHGAEHHRYYRSDTRKECAQCRQVKSRDEFYEKRAKRSPSCDRHETTCKECSKARRRTYRKAKRRAVTRPGA